MNPRATEREVIRDICRFITHGRRLDGDDAPAWLLTPPDQEVYVHPDWPGVVVVFEPSKRHVITVRVQQEPTRPRHLGAKATIMRRGLPPDTVAARATFGSLRRISAEG